MNVSTMRRIDIWFGVPACALLTLIRRCGDALRAVTGRRRNAVESILVVKLAEQGSTVLARPAIERAIQLATGRFHRSDPGSTGPRLPILPTEAAREFCDS